MSTKDLLVATQGRLRRYNLRPRKKFGQNFLVDETALTQAVACLDLTGEEAVLEIGAGLGTLTGALAERAFAVVAVEIDTDLVPILEERFPNGNVQVKQADALQLDWTRALSSYRGRELVLAGNLPYYITSPLLFKFLEEESEFTRAVFMVQREVAERLTATPGNKIYGSLTVAVEFYADCRLVMEVPSQSFYPQPDVDSALVLLTKREKPKVDVSSKEFFFRVVKALFAQRRKTILNTLSQGLTIDKQELSHILQKTGIDTKSRAEQLSIEEMALITNVMAGEN